MGQQAMREETFAMGVQNERERRGGGQIYFKELAHMIVEVGKSELYRVCHQAGDPGKSCSLSPKAVS